MYVYIEKCMCIYIYIYIKYDNTNDNSIWGLQDTRLLGAHLTHLFGAKSHSLRWCQWSAYYYYY